MFDNNCIIIAKIIYTFYFHVFLIKYRPFTYFIAPHKLLCLIKYQKKNLQGIWTIIFSLVES